MKKIQNCGHCVLCIKKKKFNIEFSHARVLQKNRNRTMHTNNGNRRKGQGITLFHLNKGLSNFKNKISDIQIAITDYNPDVISISEANLVINDHWSMSQFDDYVFLCQVAMVKSNLCVTRRSDLEFDKSAIFWLELQITSTKKLLIGAGYRQWQLPKECGIKNS